MRNARALQGYPWYYYEYTLELEYIREFGAKDSCFSFINGRIMTRSSAYDPCNCFDDTGELRVVDSGK